WQTGTVARAIGVLIVSSSNHIRRLDRIIADHGPRPIEVLVVRDDPAVDEFRLDALILGAAMQVHADADRAHDEPDDNQHDRHLDEREAALPIAVTHWPQ